MGTRVAAVANPTMADFSALMTNAINSKSDPAKSRPQDLSIAGHKELMDNVDKLLGGANSQATPTAQSVLDEMAQATKLDNAIANDPTHFSAAEIQKSHDLDAKVQKDLDKLSVTDLRGVRDAMKSGLDAFSNAAHAEVGGVRKANPGNEDLVNVAVNGDIDAQKARADTLTRWGTQNQADHYDPNAPAA